MSWLTEWMEAQSIVLWGVADLRGFPTPRDETGREFPFAISWGIPMDPQVMVTVQSGPHQGYADEYARVNRRLGELSKALEDVIRERGSRAKALAVANSPGEVDFRGEFPHKTAATRAGLGWVGRNCQLITRRFGPWLRLGTVFTDRELPCGEPVERSFCGRCTRCVDACPAKALQGNAWYPGIPREGILDARACDGWKKEHYLRYHQGRNCGICSAVCPYGLKTLQPKPGKT